MTETSKPSSRRVLIYLLIGCVALTGSHMLVKSLGYSVALSKSESLDGAIYAISPLGGQPSEGDLVLFDAPANRFLNGRFVKRVAGTAGDRVTVVGREVRLNGVTVATAKSASRKGEPLRPIPDQVIPEGFVFVVGEHIDSFDSRYFDFGLVPLSTVHGRAREIF